MSSTFHTRYRPKKLKPNADDVFILAVGRAGLMDEAKDQVRDLLRVRRQVPFASPDNFGMETSESILDNFRSITAGLAIAMFVISSVGLMVGGIGVRQHHARLSHRANARDWRP